MFTSAYAGVMNITSLRLSEHPSRVAEIQKLIATATQVDGIEPLSEQFLLGLDDARMGHRHFIAVADDAGEADGSSGAVLGVMACDDAAAEMVVAPEARRQGVASALLVELGDKDVWAHGNLPGARGLADKLERVATRRLLVMSVAGEALHAAATFENQTGLNTLNLTESVQRWGRDHVEKAWLVANNDAFSWHPEQGGWDRDRLSRAQEADWFDEQDVLFLWDTSENAMAGFHWTKWHTEEQPAFGEVYVVGLAADYRGKGLGDPLLRLGLEHLSTKGAEKVILYVEADNQPAVQVYKNLGFGVAEEHTVYSVAP